jgi:hypothetical protein
MHVPNYDVFLAVILNILVLAFFFGRLTQQIKDVDGRVERIERWLDGNLSLMRGEHGHRT